MEVTFNESKRRKLSKPSLDTTDQALFELIRKEDKDNMEIPVADVNFANSIVPISQSLPSKKNRLAKIEIQQVLMKFEFHD